MSCDDERMRRSLVGGSALDGKIFSDGFLLHLGGLHADIAVEGLVRAPLHEDVVELDGGLLLLGLVLDCVGVEGT
jgi:hypothetical protein